MILFAILIGIWSGPIGTESFSSKQAALDYLNNSNIWIAGMPSFEIDHRAGNLNVSMTSREKVTSYSIPLAKVSAALLNKRGEDVSVAIDCADKEQCVHFSSGNLKGNVDGVTMIMRSSFGDDDYTAKYIEKGGRVADAINYLHRFYKD